MSHESMKEKLAAAGLWCAVGAIIVLFLYKAHWAYSGEALSWQGYFIALCYGIGFGIVGALIPAVIYAKRVSFLNAVWAPVYSFYSMLLLSWIPVYAFFTARNSNWLTREIKTVERKREEILANAGKVNQ